MATNSSGHKTALPHRLAETWLATDAKYYLAWFELYPCSQYITYPGPADAEVVGVLPQGEVISEVQSRSGL